MAFDKTGTLTEGKPKITQVVPLGGIAETELLAIAVAVESLSSHPLARAVVRTAFPAWAAGMFPLHTMRKRCWERGWWPRWAMIKYLLETLACLAPWTVTGPRRRWWKK
ncbi:MAG TPA: HAD family hydrolase [Cyclobacteriaceae bacterium]|nr:HAD family hydrolase [Cyclobacteriaceae bacterium]